MFVQIYAVHPDAGVKVIYSMALTAPDDIGKCGIKEEKTFLPLYRIFQSSFRYQEERLHLVKSFLLVTETAYTTFKLLMTWSRDFGPDLKTKKKNKKKKKTPRLTLKH